MECDAMQQEEHRVDAVGITATATVEWRAVVRAHVHKSCSDHGRYDKTFMFLDMCMCVCLRGERACVCYLARVGTSRWSIESTGKTPSLPHSPGICTYSELNAHMYASDTPISTNRTAAP